MVTKQKHFLDSLRQMVSKSAEGICPNCKKTHEGDICAEGDGHGSDASGNQATEAAFLVDLVSNHKIKIPIPSCEIGRDETNDIVVSGDQSISRHHLRLIYDAGQYFLEDNNSRHGTFLNGTQIKTRELINDGDVIKIGVSLFWFVIEATNASEDNSAESTSNFTGPSKLGSGEPAHLNVRSDHQSAPSDPVSSTMNEIPVMPNEQTLLENLRLKTRSFDQAGLFASAQSQAATIAPQSLSGSGKSVEDTQSDIPVMSLDPLSNSKNDAADNFPGSEQSTPLPTSVASAPAKYEAQQQEINMSPPDLSSGTTVYDQLMSSDLAELTGKYNRLKDEIDRAQRERQEIADRLNSMRSIGINLIGGTDGQLLESCHKVFSDLGWQISINSNDPQELVLKLHEKVSLARIIWTTDEPERSHLGQLSISQTNLWCELGEEPKGILVISRLANKDNEIPRLTKADYESELAKYAAKKNVCMMTSMQVLAIYRDLILKHSDVNSLREKIMNTAGWLDGFAVH